MDVCLQDLKNTNEPPQQFGPFFLSHNGKSHFLNVHAKVFIKAA